MSKLLPLSLVAAATFIIPLHSQDWVQTWIQTGDNRGDTFGYAVADGGDLNGDGLNDVLIGALGADFNGRNSGSVYMLSGLDGSEIMRIDGENFGDMFGVSVTSMGDLTGDGVPEFAAGAPFYSGSHFFQGRAYLIDGATGLSLDTIDGASEGELLGVAVAGMDHNGDGTMDLAVGIIGANAGGTAPMAGEVQLFSWDGTSLMAGDVLGASTANSSVGQWFGFSLACVGDLDGSLGDELLVGIPYANNTGKASVLTKHIGEDLREKLFYVGSAGDQIGVSVAGTLTDNGNVYVAAGGPEAANGNGVAIVWENAPDNVKARFDGAAGDNLGYALSFHPDANFDGIADLILGSPGNGGTGKIQVYDMQTLAELFSSVGNAGSQLGWAAAVVGDTNGSLIDDLVASAPRTSATSKRQGLAMVISPPDSNIGPMVLTLDGGLMQGEPQTLTLSSIKENADVYFYAGGNANPSTSADGFNLDIGALLGTSGNDYFDLQSNVLGGATTATFNVPATTPAGATLYFQVGEWRSGFVRTSNTVSNDVLEHPLELSLDGHPTAGAAIEITADYAWANQVIYFFAAQQTGTQGYLGFIGNTGLGNPQYVSQLQADANGTAIANWTVPASFMGQSTVGAPLYFSAVSLSSANEKLGVIGPYIIQ